MILILIIFFLLFFCFSRCNKSNSHSSPQVEIGISSDADDSEKLINRIEWLNNVNLRVPIHWRIMTISIISSVIVLLVISKSWNFPEAVPLIQTIVVLFVALYSAHKYFDRHNEFYYSRIYTQKAVERLRKKVGTKRFLPEKITNWKLLPECDPFWYISPL